MAFTKLHGEIIYSSIWGHSDAVRIVWITMLAMADEHGVVAASVSGLARAANVPMDRCREALELFLDQEEDSRDDTTGERIERVPGGWLVLNHANYRDKQTVAQAKTAARVAKHKAKRRREATVIANKVTGGNATPPSEAEAEAEADYLDNQGVPSVLDQSGEGVRTPVPGLDSVGRPLAP